MHIRINLSKKIISWYDNNKRVLPWRVPYNSPRKLYYRLLSEFMLQQTQVKTVIPYFKKFTKKIKTLKKLSSTSERKVLKLFPNAKKKLNIVKNGDHSLSSKKGLKIILKELKLLI